jgi:hypothetical protein
MNVEGKREVMKLHFVYIDHLKNKVVRIRIAQHSPLKTISAYVEGKVYLYCYMSK